MASRAMSSGSSSSSSSSSSSCSASRQRRLFLLLQRCRSSTRHLSQVHAQLILQGFSQKSSLLHKLISSCASCGDLPRALRAFELAEGPSVTSWNQIIRGFAGSDAPHVSLLLYNRMRAGGHNARPNGYTYSFLLNACTSLPREGAQVHGVVLKCGFLKSSAFVQTSLIDMYASVNRDDDAVGMARRVFDEMPRRSVAAWNSMLAGYLRAGNMELAREVFHEMPERDSVSWTTMISGCVRMGRSEQAVSKFRRMWEAGVEVDRVTMLAALSACADLGDLELGRWIHAYVDRRLVWTRTVSLNNSLINMYAKCGSIEEAYGVFRAMPRRSTVTWTTMIMGLVMHGRCEDALHVFHEMLRGAEQPDDVTFIWVLCACSHAEKIDEGHRFFEEMKTRFGIKPRIEHYSCLVDMLGRAGCVADARELIDRMPMEPNEAIWSALLRGCRIHGNLNVANHVAGELLELGGGGNLALLSSLYAVFGKWEDSLRVRKTLVEMGLQKPAGRSWVLVSGEIHEFTSGDQGKQCDATVYKMLHEMIVRAKGAGYVPNLSQVVLDVDDEEKESFLYLHSEKLAIAFAMVNVIDVRAPLRIAMNLRMCCDCHSLARFVSLSFKRDVMVRERNRLHHFSRGACSCNHIAC